MTENNFITNFYLVTEFSDNLICQNLRKILGEDHQMR